MAGLYLHIPFCKQACHYCNFHFSTSLRYKGDMIEAIKKEIKLQSNYLNNETVETVYFGGGTPSVLNAEEIQELVIDLLQDEIEQILRLPREKLDVERSIFDLGMDSLMGMELVLAIEERFGVKLPVMALTEGANILRIAERITEKLSVVDTDHDSSSDAIEKEHHEDNISMAASRHGHAANMTEAEAEALSKKLIEDAMKH